MKLGLKITAFVLSCFLLQGPCANAAKTDADATKKLNETMENVVKLLKDHGYDFSRFVNYINGNESHKNTNAIEVETALGEDPVLIIKKTEDGKFNVLASRRGRYEANVDLTKDETHQAIANKIQSQGLDKPVVHEYKDHTGAQFRVLAYPINLLEKEQAPEKRTQGFIYAATEVEIIPEAATAR